MMYKDIFKEFLIECEYRNLSKRTLKNYRCHLRLFNEFLEKSDISELSEINASLIKRFILAKKDNNCKVGYLNGIIKTLNAFFKYCDSEGYLQNFMPSVKFLKGPKPIIKTFTNEEVKRMLDVYSGKDYLSIRNKLVLAVFFDTGIRNFELCNVKDSDVKDSFIRIFGKGRKERVVPISTYVARIKVRYERARNGYFQKAIRHDDNYFLSRTGRKLTVEAVERIVRIAGEKANVNSHIRCSPHTCRHYYAQSSLLNGVDIYTVSRLLGHSNVSITQVYVRSMMDSDILDVGREHSPLMNL